MNIQEILQLDKVQASIKKIDLFLVSQVKLSNEYLLALSYKASILHKIGKTNEALKLLFTLVPSIKEMDVDGIITLCDGIIEICLDLRRFDQVSKYIKIKQTYLPISKAVYHIKDNIKLYVAQKKYQEAKNELLKYLEDDITQEEAIYAKEELAKIYFYENQYEKFIEIAQQLEKYYQNNLALTSYADIELKKLKAIFSLGNYLKVITEGLTYIKDEVLSISQKIEASTLLIKSYLLGNDYKRASIIESEYCEYISEDFPEESLEFCYAALELYTKTNTLVSITEYQNKIKEFDSHRKEVKQIKKKKSKEEDIVIPVVPDVQKEEEPTILTSTIVEVKEENQQKIVPEIVKIKSVMVSDVYEKLSSVFQTINELDVSLKFREIFRSCCIKLCELFPISEVYVLYFKKQYLGIHYKKERAYDKKLQFEDLDKTLSFAALHFEKEMFLDEENNNYNRDIVSGNLYEKIPYGFAVPFMDNLKAVGSIAFFSDNPFLDKEMTYESLKLISTMLNTRLLQSMKQDELQFNNRKLFFIHENMSSGLKENMDGYYHFSGECTKILGVLEDMTEDDYLSKMKTEDIISYRNIHEELYTLLSENLSLEYDFKKDNHWIRIRERFYPMVLDGIICILSLIDDITEHEQKRKELISLAYKNPISKLETEVKLMVDLNQKMQDKKLSLAVIDIIDFNLYRELYGYNFSNQLIYAVGQKLVDFYSNDFNINVYHLEVDRYVILLDGMNDKRAVDSKLRQSFIYVKDKLFELNYRVKLSFNAGVYRCARHTNIDDPSKVLYYALDALSDAKEMKDSNTHIFHFDSDAHKKKFNENQLITHISESIDHGKLGLTYRQIVDFEKKEVFAYRLRLNLDNYEVDDSYMDFVVKRRGITTQIEKYAISNVYKELKMVHDTLRGYILCFIDVSPETLEENFYVFLETQKSFYKIPNEYLVFHVQDAKRPILKKLRQEGYKISSNQVLDVYANACDYFLYDIHISTSETMDEMIELCKRHECTCILNHIDTKEDLDLLVDKKDVLLYGSYYHKAIRMKTLIDKMKS